MKRNAGVVSTVLLAGSLLFVPGCAAEEVAVEISTADVTVVGAFRTDASRSGSSTGEVGDRPRVAYRIEGTEPVIASPVIADGTAFVPDGDGDLVAFEAGSGQVLWRSTIGSADASVVVSRDSVFSVSSSAVVRRHDLGSGAVIWETELDGSARSSLLLAEERLLAVAGGVLHLLEPSTGAQIASIDLGGRADSSPAYGDGTVVLGTAADRIALVDLESQSVAFVELPSAPPELTTFADGVAATPAIVDGLVFVGSTSGLFVAVTSAGEIAWEADLASPIYGAAAIGPALGYVPTAAGELIAFDRSSGEQVWATDLSDASYSSPVLAGDVVLVTAENGVLFAFAADTGESRWSIEIGEAGNYMASTPVMVDSMVIVGSNDGSIVGVETGR